MWMDGWPLLATGVLQRTMMSATHKVGQFYLGRSSRFGMTSTALCDRLGLTFKVLYPRECRLAEALLLASFREQQAFEHSLSLKAAKGEVDLLFFVEFGRMDETPMKLTSASLEDAAGVSKEPCRL